MTLAHKTIIGVLWNFAEQIGRRGIGMIVTLLLAQVLAPEDFGIVAMMAVFLAVGSSLMESGFKQALIRLEEVSPTDFNTAFYANLALGLISYTLLFLLAPYIAAFYEEPRLIELVRVAALGVVINSFQVVQSAILSRELNFKLQLQATLPAGLISGMVAVGLAYANFGVWALIVQMLLAAFVTTLVLWHKQRWRPKLSFCRQSLSQMYNFGYKLFLSGLLDTVFKNIYVIVIAKIFSSSLAGFYFFADKIKELVISQLVNSIQTVTFPALATMQADTIRLKAGYRNIILVTTFLVFPTMLFLAAMAEPLFAVFLPARWAPATAYLQLMCLGAMLYPLHSLNVNILKVKGRSELFLYLEIIKKILGVTVLFIAYRYGVMGILIGQIVGSALAYLPNSYFSERLIGYSAVEQIADVMPGLLLSLAVGGFTYAAVRYSTLPALANLLLWGVLAGGFYLFSAHKLKLHAYMMAKELIGHRFSRFKE